MEILGLVSRARLAVSLDGWDSVLADLYTAEPWTEPPQL